MKGIYVPSQVQAQTPVSKRNSPDLEENLDPKAKITKINSRQELLGNTFQKFDYSGNIANVINLVNTTSKGASASGNINLKWMRKLRQ